MQMARKARKVAEKRGSKPRARAPKNLERNQPGPYITEREFYNTLGHFASEMNRAAVERQSNELSRIVRTAHAREAMGQLIAKDITEPEVVARLAFEYADAMLKAETSALFTPIVPESDVPQIEERG
jgi:hypothetical protein